jgi:hypothetical protein
MRKERCMELANHYRPADHAASLRRALSAWLVYGFLLVVGLGLPSLWAEVREGPAAPITAKASPTADQVCENQRRPPKPVAKDHLG